MGALSLFGVFGGILYVVLFVALIAASIRAIVMTVRVPPRASREPACELCGYRVAGLSAFRCPECGTDLRASGIITLPMEIRRRGSILAAVTGWIFLMLVVGSIGLSLISLLQFRPMMSAAATGSMTTTTPLTPASGAYTRLDATSTVTYGPRPTGSTDIDLVLKDGSTWRLTFAPLGASYTIIGPDGTGTTTLDDGKSADALFAAAGLDLTDAKVNAESRELSTIIGVTAASPWTPVNTMRLRALTPGSPAVTSTAATAAGSGDMSFFIIALMVASVIWVTVLVLGIVYIISRRRKLLRAYPTPPIPAASAPPAPSRA